MNNNQDNYECRFITPSSYIHRYFYKTRITGTDEQTRDIPPHGTYKKGTLYELLVVHEFVSWRFVD